MGVAGVAVGAMVAGAVVQGIAAHQQGKDAEALNKYNARLSENEATQTRVSTAEAQKIKRREMRRTLARNRALVAESGVQMRGSPAQHQLSVIDDFAYDISRVGREGEIQAQRSESQAEIFKMRAKSARRAGKLGTIAAALGGVSQVAGFKAQESLNN